MYEVILSIQRSRGVAKPQQFAVPALVKTQSLHYKLNFGPNALQEAKQKSRLSILLAQFADVMILILAIAAVISFVVGEHTDAYVIIAIIVANAWMGYSQEYNAEKSVRMLQKMSAQFALVVRNNNPAKLRQASWYRAISFCWKPATSYLRMPG